MQHTHKLKKYMPKYIYKPLEIASIEDYIICNSELSKKSDINDLIYLKTIKLNICLEKGQYICGHSALLLYRGWLCSKYNIYLTKSMLKSELIETAKTCQYLETKEYLCVLAFSFAFTRYISNTNNTLKIYKKLYSSKKSLLQSFDLDSYRILINRHGHVFTNVNGLYALQKKINIINIHNDSNSLLKHIIKHEKLGYIAKHPFSQNGYVKDLPEIQYTNVNYKSKKTVILLNLFNMISGNYAKLFYVNGQTIKKEVFINAFLKHKSTYKWERFLCYKHTVDYNLCQRDLHKHILSKIHCMYPYYYSLSSNHYNSIPLIHKLSQIYTHYKSLDFIARNPEIMAIYFGLKKHKIPKYIIWRIIAFMFKMRILKKISF